MATITLKGNPVHTSGELPTIGSKAPNFRLVKQDLSEVSLADLAGKKVVINIFPSIDTDTCATSVRKFNQKASSLANTVVLCVSKDLPFAAKRFCGAEGLANVVTASAFRDTEFEKAYGVQIVDSPLKGLCARSIVILDESGKVVYTQQVPETVDEPDYDAALARI
ncbi:MAG TPA: thiol peroxidase [Fibrobacteria bacterium]|nr:thiol peroxidase [Fibrobacteria bacterium]HOX52186.1 thiol peroxidase [Fibrobacteria bacterium]